MKQTILPCGVLIIIAITIGTLLFAEQCVGQNEKQEKTGQLRSSAKPLADSQLEVMEIPEGYVAGQGEMLVLRQGKKLALPLAHTDVSGRIDGFLARVQVTQTFINLIVTTIEALYTFPLPENAAVDSMIMIIGKKRIKGVIKERGEARAMYEQARRDGKTASLLEQERPNIFTQSIANILPDDTILVKISYVQELKYRDGRYKFSFPMVVGPRYIPGNPLRPENRGTVKPTDQVPDAHRITPPLLPPDVRSGHDISMQVVVNAGTVLKEVGSPSHKVKIVQNNDKTITVGIMPNDRIPNKGFMLDYAVAGGEIKNVVLTHHPGNGDGFFQLIMIPKHDIDTREIFPRELVFVVDNSGSMMGFPIEKCKEIIRLCLKNMRRDDVFRLIKFAGSTDIMSPEPLKATPGNVTSAMQYVDGMRGGGGTEMMKAINAIFDLPHVEGRKRLVLFLTDGYVGNEQRIITTIRNRLANSRVFSLGVGSSVNHYLLEGMAYTGRGVCMTIRQDGEAGKATREFYSLIDAPVLTDIQLKWNGVKVHETVPAQLPDLFHGQPLVLTGKYTEPGAGSVTIVGKLPGGRKYIKKVNIRLPKKEKNNGVLATLWARGKIKETSLLGSQLFSDASYTPQEVKEQITKLGLEYRIMTQYTSFVAIDDAVRNKEGKWVSVEQALPMPEGVSHLSQPRERFAKIRKMRRGVLGIITGQAKRKGAAGIGYGAGYGSGFGGGSGGADDLIGSLMGGDAGGLGLKKRGSLKIASPQFTKGGSLTGSRSKASVMRVIMQNLAAIRYAYNRRLREKPGLKGRITVKFAIDEFGRVIFCQVVSSTMGDPELEKKVVEKIKRWVFEKIDKPGDVTEVVYPFVFSQ